MDRSSFGDSFYWGVSTAAFQTEGGWDADGKGPSIWDVFSSRQTTIKKGDDARIACNFYEDYAGDISLVRQLHIPNFRFSISWPRIFPTGTGKVNPHGIDYYNRLIDTCLEQGIEPWVTLYHWDLPQALEEKGGWTNRDVLYWLEEYAACCIKHFGDRVRHWMVLNEPAVFIGAGYFFGVHAPGRKGLPNFLPAVHHATLSMGRIGRLLRRELPAAQVGTTFSSSHIEPASGKAKDIAAAGRADAMINRLFIEPILGLGYPLKDVKSLASIEKYMQAGDEALMPFDFDFIGLQVYTREIVKYSWMVPYLRARLVEAPKRGVPLTQMNWEVYPPSIYHALKKVSVYPGVPPIIITENGAAFPDTAKEGAVHDPERVAFLQDYLAQVLRAKQEGCDVMGYFVWTLTDNFEWAEGYHPRFGLVYVDFETQQRIVKSSGSWYAQFLKK